MVIKNVMQQTLINVNPSSSWSWAWPSLVPAYSIKISSNCPALYICYNQIRISAPETRYNCNESESGGSGGSWRVLKHPEVSASIMLDPPNRLQKKLAILFLQDRGQTKFCFGKKTFEYWFWIANIWIISADPKFPPQL